MFSGHVLVWAGRAFPEDVYKRQSKEDALEEYSSTISGNADATLSALDGQNPLPRSFRIEMEEDVYKRQVYRTIDAKFNAVADEIEQRHAAGQPVLVGTVSIEKMCIRDSR